MEVHRKGREYGERRHKNAGGEMVGDILGWAAGLQELQADDLKE